MSGAEKHELELSDEALARLIDAAKDRILAHIASLPQQPSASVEGGIALAHELEEPLVRLPLLRERLEDCRPCVIVANHQSFLDVVTYGSMFPRRTVSAGKREIGRIPLFGWFYRLSGNLVIDRSHARSAHDALEAAAKAMADEKISLWFMPEGHRNMSGTLLPFKSGAFRLAIAAGVPILPVVAEPLTAIADPPHRRLRPGSLRVRVLDPIPTAGLTHKDVPGLMENVRSTMQAALDGLKAA